jgi:ABC-type amino acid transport substrate-binding protein
MKARLIATVLVAVATTTAAAKAAPITLYGNSEQPPKAWLDKDTPRGFGIDVAVEVLKRAGFDVTISLAPFARAMEQTKQGGIMTGVFYNAERAKFLDYSEPLFYEDVVAVVAKGKEFPLEKASDLAGKKVGVQPALFYGDDFAAASGQLALENDTSPSARLKKLAAGRIDVAMLNPGRAAFISSAAEAGLSEDGFTVLPKPLARLSNHLVVGKGVAGGADILARVNKVIAEATADGTIGKIMAKYDQ